jgi:hypothetical protein
MRRKVVEVVCAVIFSGDIFTSTIDCAGFACVSLIASFFSQPVSVMHPTAIKAKTHNLCIGRRVWFVPSLPE